MFFPKLQFGCLLLTLYIIYLYVKQTLNKCTSCNKYYDLLMYTAPWAIIFDGATYWSVNHLNIVPHFVNLILHYLFFFFMVATLLSTFLYILDETEGLPENKLLKFLIYLPFISSITIGAVCLKNLDFIEGKNTNYSMGISVYCCFLSVLIYYTMTIISTFNRRKELEKRKRTCIYTVIISTAILVIVQIIYPEVLLTSLVPTIYILGLYINTEDPFIKQIEQYNNNMVLGFSTLVESRDSSTGGHIKRTQTYVSILIEEMKKSGTKYNYILTKDFIKNIKQAAPMHDIGKIGTPDVILTKPGKLTDEEYNIMKQHSIKGGEIILDTFADLNDSEFLKIAYNVTRFHHEKWNGKGYPEGLKGEEIPLSARIMAIADVFDAISAKRCYRNALPLETCYKIMEEGIGTDFDPELAKLFLQAWDKVTEYCIKNRE